MEVKGDAFIMAKIGYILVCETVAQDENERRFLINPKSEITIKELKTNIEFTVSISVYDIKNVSFYVTIEIYDPDGKLISRKENNFSHPQPIKDFEKNPFSVITNSSFKEVLIQKYGVFTIKVTVEDDEKTLNIPIEQYNLEDVN